jgi:hypothetical protein
MSVEYDRIYEIPLQAALDLSYKIAIDKEGDEEATHATLQTVSNLIDADIRGGIISDILDYVCPVGGVIGLHKSLAGVPVLTDNYMEMDGSTVNDTDSPLYGETLEDWNGDERYLGGHATTSGTELEDQIQDHLHWETFGNTAGALTTAQIVPSLANYGTTQGTSAAKTDGVHGAIRAGSITRPITATIIWIIRIK